MLLHAEGIKKSYNGVPALLNGCLDLERGSIHALCGGNGAGKSTFLKVVMGLVRRDDGTLEVQGRPCNFAVPSQALAAGISIITQELSPIPAMTVAENLWLGRERMRGALFVDRRRAERDAQVLFDRLGFPIDARLPMGELSVARMQLVEIAKAISYESPIVIMDEPTSAIGETETETLFRAIRSLQAQGTGIVYVSHRLNEIFQIADRFTVFRDGSMVETGRIADISRGELIRHIVGREVLRRPRTDADALARGPVLLQVRGLAQKPMVHGVDLDAHAGEIVGIYGVVGAGRSEFLNAVYGLTTPDAGTVTVEGVPLPPGRPRAAIGAGLSLVTEDRKETGLVTKRSVRENTSLAALKDLSRAGFIVRGRENRLVGDMMRRFQIKAASPELSVASLSGGNQQKVVLSRCFSTEPRVLLCDEPTRGVDEGAKMEIYATLRSFVAAGNAAVVVSSDLEEILHVSDRIIVFNRGRIVAEMPAQEANNENLLHHAS